MEISLSIGKNSPEGLLIAFRLAEAASKSNPYLSKIHVLLEKESLKALNCPKNEFFLNQDKVKSKVLEKINFYEMYTTSETDKAKFKNSYIHIACFGYQTPEDKAKKLIKWGKWLLDCFDDRSLLVILDTIKHFSEVLVDTDGNDIFSKQQQMYTLIGTPSFLAKAEIKGTRIDVFNLTWGNILLERVNREKVHLKRYLGFLDEINRIPILYYPSENSFNWLYPCLVFKSYFYFVYYYKKDYKITGSFYNCITNHSELRLLFLELLNESFNLTLKDQDLSLLEVSSSPIGIQSSLRELRLLFSLPNAPFKLFLKLIFYFKFNTMSLAMPHEVEIEYLTEEIKHCRNEIIQTASMNSVDLTEFHLFQKKMDITELIEISKKKQRIMNETYVQVFIALIPILLLLVCQFVLHAWHILFYT